MIRRGCAMILLFLISFALLGCQQGSSFSNPRAVSFKEVGSPIKERSLKSMAREINIRVRMMSSNLRPRKKSSKMKPLFITIHSTGNHRKTATAMQHSRALSNGVFKTKNWHFSVDQYMAIQHVPLNETAWHAGTKAGNTHSIGIEMCESESRGNNHFRTWDRTAKLTALLMVRYNLDLRHVVPHYFWYGKSCPGPLMTNGKPSYKWAWYISRVDYYYRCLNGGRANR